MFRVPLNPDYPTFDQTEKIGFVRWLTSGKAERVEWARRRNAAAQLARTNQVARGQEWVDRKQAERDGRHPGQ